MTRAAAAKSAPPTVTRQKLAGEAMRQRSRERLVTAAGEVFAEEGYAGATVSTIAARAGVSLQTLYTAWGSKRRLLRALVEYTMTGSPTAITEGKWVPQQQDLLDEESRSNPLARMRRVAQVFRRIAERMNTPWQLLRDGSAVDPGVAEDYAELERLRRYSMAGLLDGIDEADLRPGLTLDGAIDTMLVIASPAAHQTLVHRHGYSMDRFEAWVADTLTAALLALPAPGTASCRDPTP
ncbi:TetR/AcrR family transcriptional regulator [Geodermatophilus sp. TF02-6]|uniref:TetR/AcrR family transcriptional regulator n=1 Tax=Geodermatophilus sp. TF02-6 TaxID=2250575 RepID=UPI000DEA3016|nr:TetR/AcrR family transcriptional regulator [Geodermatophilus sp. TF02-6]RBY77275.1 TetR/AcrR family transcriptional regulator [Geodermatophilus sp. TF02-6]